MFRYRTDNGVPLEFAVIGLDDVAHGLLWEACRTLRSCLGVVCHVEGYEGLRPELYDPNRGQYRAEPVLKLLARRARKRLLLALANVDAYAEDLNFIFGMAGLAEGVAMVLLPRLRPEFYGGRSDREVFLSRLRKETLHEVGHLLGLGHCRNHCVMEFSNSIEEVDSKPEGFCNECSRKLERIGVNAGCRA